MYFNRFDICEAWYLALSECHDGQWSENYKRLCNMIRYFKPSPILSVDSLTENGRAIYDDAIVKLGGQT
jgi:hypothetical protein